MSQNIQTGSVKEVLKKLRFDNALVIFSPTSVAKAGVQQEINDLGFSTLSATGINYESLSDFGDYDTYVGFGGGTAIDIAKFLSHRNPPSTCVAIPSMLSTNVFATNKTAAIYKTHKKTVDSKLPDTVILDYDLLEKSMQENIFGLADALSIHTAMRDWLIADRKGVEPVAYKFLGWDTSILYKAQEIVKNITAPFPDDATTVIQGIFDVLLQAGYITNEWGCGRPESGSEHIVAKYIEELVSVPHAVAVTCGIAIVSQLQKNHVAVTELMQLGMFDAVRNSEVTKEVLIQALQNVKPREGRYTVIDLWVGQDGHLHNDLINQLVQNSGLYD